MGLYRESYAFVLKKNFMLLIIAVALLFFTFAFWVGIPIFVVGDLLFKINMPFFIYTVFISISIGLLFTLFFIPINLKVAKMVGKMKERSTLQTFIRLQSVFVLVSAIFLSIIFGLIIWAVGFFPYTFGSISVN